MRYISLLFFSLLLFLVSCENPFFPPVPETSRPLEVVDQRQSPIGVINLLIKAYEYRNIGLYTSLLTNDFRFYVASGFDQTDRKYKGPLISEKPDTFIVNITDKSRSFLFWDSVAEVYSTRNMFNQTISIEIDEYQIDAPIYHCDSLYAEVVVSKLLLDITVNNGFEFKIVNEPQVFIMKRVELNGLKIWLIRKWYDLGTESSSGA
jgi:hypothetical protein